MGILETPFPDQAADEVTEFWLGPCGESIYLVRPNDSRMLSYAGGNPIDLRNKKTRAYYSFTAESQNHLDICIPSLVKSFGEHQTKRIACAEFDCPPTQIGFDDPDELDARRVLHISQMGRPIVPRMTIDLEYDLRFIAKCAYGIGYCLLGESFLLTNYSKELLNGVWRRDRNVTPALRGKSTLCDENNEMVRLGLSGATVIFILLIPGTGLSLQVNVNKKICFTTMICPIEEMDSSDVYKYKDGTVVVLLNELETSYSMNMIEYICYIQGAITNAGLHSALSIYNSHRLLIK